ncbi:MAG: CBS domain-containing protein [Candidatus Eisenbacteria bacterium]|uniref:CBS domain-containing protein n=1 Tax=Eiseniibacteriota bacterium TaxID=2212470 RepID=A0A849SQW5_UNCEI|nr:CBS domain-containing protein [Candidatus Eisenbacteria bacterium]
MATVQAILDRKGSEVVSLGPEHTVLAAAHLMNQRAIGGVVVVENDRVIGMFTERDVLRRVVSERRDPATTLLRDVMTAPVETCEVASSIDACKAAMTERRVRHLPVLHDQRLIGIVTIGDLIAFEVGEKDSTIVQLNQYIFGAT